MSEIINPGILMTDQQTYIINETIKNESGRLLRFIRSKVNTDEDAQDILQDVFYQLASNYGVVESIENMAAWLFRVARNRIIDVYRKKKPLSIDTSFSDDEDNTYFFNLSKVMTEASDNPDGIYERALVWDTLYEALEELPEEQKDVFILHELENKSFNEISKLTGVAVNTLLSRKRYAVLHLRERLKNLYTELINEDNYEKY